MSTARSRHHEDGFTLIEMVIAFAILGLVITALYTFYLSGLQSWNRSIDRMEYQQTTRIAMDKMIRELQNAHLAKCSIDPDYDCSGNPSEIIYFRNHINGISTRHSFRLKNTQLHLDRRRDSNNSIKATNVVALGITGLEFVIGENDTVFITVQAGKGSGATTLSGAVRPRNLPGGFPVQDELDNDETGSKDEQE